MNYRVTGYSDGFHGDDGESFGLYNTRNFLRDSVLGGGCIP